MQDENCKKQTTPVRLSGKRRRLEMGFCTHGPLLINIYRGYFL